MKYQVALSFLTMSEASAQASASDLSFFPVHIGDVWVYQVSSYSPHEPRWTPFDTVTVEIVADSVYANNKRYFLFNTGWLVRVDSTDGRVYSPLRSQPQMNGCPDSTEQEVFNLTVDSTFQYLPCPTGGIGMDRCTVIPLGSERVGALNLMRQQRIWGCWYLYSKLSQGIGISLKEGGGVGGNQHLLIYARINGTEYWPVELKSFTATLQRDNSILLNWATENEVQNLGFTVQRRDAERLEEEWTSLAFVPSNVQEGRSGEYTFTDHPIQSGTSGRTLQYRLLQHDYDGSVSHLPVADVQLTPSPVTPHLTLYPNPARTGDVLSVRLHNIPAGKIQLFDALGRHLLSRHISRDATIPTSGLTAGVYFLRLRNNAGIFAGKVLVR